MLADDWSIESSMCSGGLLWDENRLFLGLVYYHHGMWWDEPKKSRWNRERKLLSKFIATCVPTSVCFQPAQSWHYHEADLEHYMVLQGLYQAGIILDKFMAESVPRVLRILPSSPKTDHVLGAGPALQGCRCSPGNQKPPSVGSSSLETDSQTYRTNLWLPEGKEGEKG